ncbi:hypothetical protein DICVIV_06556 [Dictyocaulus viviparus]|uniref:Protein kinase domain-containing protein n=1 Tax=Dictyocaulus viviparus TaxID=29172 RepID=A0A0D8XYC0_DICVI|nr:hypothetical protein DICVIV_06556 [Dictyocaulus viviparus]
MLYNNDFELPELGTTVSFKGHTWDVLKKIYEGIFSHVYMLRDVMDHRKLYAMKVEKQFNCERPVLKLDVAVLSQLKNTIGFPTLIIAGRTDTFKFCVMRLVGPDIRSLMWEMPNRRFSPSTSYRIAMQTLDRLEKLHEIGYINRDVKSQNFAIGLGNQSSIIFMLDFGLTRRFRNQDGTLVKRRVSGPCVGTYPFAPLASATMRDQAPKDDLEGWFYMMMEIFTGYLPWHNNQLILDHSLTREWKQYVRGAYKTTMLESLPYEFTPIFNNIISMRFEEQPRYHFIRRMVGASVSRQGINLALPYDWQVEPSLLSLIKKTTEYTTVPAPVILNALGSYQDMTAVEVIPYLEPNQIIPISTCP